MRIRNRATAIRSISQSRARRQGRSKMLNSATARSSATASSAKKNSIAYANNQNATGMSQLRQYYIYEELSKTAEGLQEHAKTLLKYGETTVEQKKEETKEETKEESKQLTAEEIQKKEKETKEEKESIINTVRKVINTFNIIREDLGDIGNNTNKVFQKQLDTIVKNYEKKLEEIGITTDKNGKLSMDEKKVKEADLGKMKNIFCDKKGLANDLKEKCQTIKENTDTSLRMFNRMYGSTSTYNKNATSNPYYNQLYGKYSALG